MRSFVAVLCVVVLLLTGCSKKELEEAKAKLEATQPQLDAANKKAADDAKKADDEKRQKTVEDTAKKVAEESVKKSLSQVSATSLAMQAINQGAQSKSGNSSVQIPDAHIAMRTGESANIYEMGEADKKRFEGRAQLEEIRVQMELRRFQEAKEKLETAECREAELRDNISELRDKIKDTEKSLSSAKIRNAPRPYLPPTNEDRARQIEIDRDHKSIYAMKAEVTILIAELKKVSTNISQLTQTTANRTTVSKRFWDPANCRWVYMNVTE